MTEQYGIRFLRENADGKGWHMVAVEDVREKILRTFRRLLLNQQKQSNKNNEIGSNKSEVTVDVCCAVVTRRPQTLRVPNHVFRLRNFFPFNNPEKKAQKHENISCAEQFGCLYTRSCL